MEAKMERRLFKWMGLLAAGMAALLTLFLVTGCSSGSSDSSGSDSGQKEATGTSNSVYRTLDEIKDSGSIRIGVFSDKNPFGYVDNNGDYQGYDVELARQIAKDLDVDLEFVSTEAASRIEFLTSGQVDIILANFTVTPERAEEVDFAEAYMNVALGIVSPDSNVITDLSQVSDSDNIIVITGTTAETYLSEHYPEIKLRKFETYASAKTALENGEAVAWANDNTEVIAYANTTDGYTVGIEQLGDIDVIAPAVAKGNASLLDWLNEELKKLGSENFFHADYEKTLADTYGADYEETLVVEPGQTA